MKKYFSIILFCSVLVLAGKGIGQSKAPLFFREDWKEIPAELPVTQNHVANNDLELMLYGPGKDLIKKSNHPPIPNDPYYIWSGECLGNWAVSLRHKSKLVDLSGSSSMIRWRTKQAGFRQLRIILKLEDGTWLVSDQYDGESDDWRVKEFRIPDIKWRTLNIERIYEGKWAEKPDLSRIEEVGFTDLMPGGQSVSCSRLDWIEVYGKPVAK